MGRLLGGVLNVKNVDKYTFINEDGEEETDMCTAIREMIEDAKNEERERTREANARAEEANKRANLLEKDLKRYIDRYGKLD